jgi:hypothetical protein
MAHKEAQPLKRGHRAHANELKTVHPTFFQDKTASAWERGTFKMAISLMVPANALGIPQPPV